jgi:cytochrome P450
VVKARIWNGDEVWLVTRYDEVREVFRDHETFSQRAQPGYPSVTPGRYTVVMGEKPTFLRMDPPDHTRYRRMLTADFAVKRVNALRPRMEAIVDGLIDDMLAKGPPADIVADLALPLPTTVIAELLGLPHEDCDYIAERTATRFSSDGAAAQQALRDLMAYMDGQIRQKRALSPEPDDLMMRLLRNFVDPGELEYDEALQMLELLLVGGHDTTANMTGLGILTLLEYPDQADLLRRNPELMGSAVNELLRFLTVNQNVGGRVCVRDTVLGGQHIRAGEGVYALMPSANRDDAVFADPDRFDITRDPTNHMAFGYGAHQCLGMNLAKAELEVVYGRVLDRLPTLKLAVPFEELKFKHDALIFGAKSLPVSW